MGNAIRRVYRLQVLNLIRLIKWVFWGAVFFLGGLSVGLYHNATPDMRDKIPNATLVAYGVLAVMGFLLRLWEWRVSRPVVEKTSR